MVTVAIMQSAYLPWLGFFDKARNCDVFVIYDTAQYCKNDFHNRNRIRLGNEWVWLSVPIRSSGKPKLQEVEIDNSRDWKQKHILTIRHAYGKAKYSHDYIADVDSVLCKKWERLIDLQMAFIKMHFDWLGISATIVMASEIPGILEPDRNLRLVNVCKAFQGDTYLSGDVAKCYLDEKLFNDAGIKVQWQGFSNPVYSQLSGEDGFIPQMAAIDLLMNCGDRSLEYLEKPSSRIEILKNPTIFCL